MKKLSVLMMALVLMLTSCAGPNVEKKENEKFNIDNVKVEFKAGIRSTDIVKDGNDIYIRQPSNFDHKSAYFSVKYKDKIIEEKILYEDTVFGKQDLQAYLEGRTEITNMDEIDEKMSFSIMDNKVRIILLKHIQVFDSGKYKENTLYGITDYSKCSLLSIYDSKNDKNIKLSYDKEILKEYKVDLINLDDNNLEIYNKTWIALYNYDSKENFETIKKYYTFNSEPEDFEDCFNELNEDYGYEYKLEESIVYDNNGFIADEVETGIFNYYLKINNYSAKFVDTTENKSYEFTSLLKLDDPELLYELQYGILLNPLKHEIMYF